MSLTYIRNPNTGKFEQVGPGGATTDTTLTLVGKPADAQAVGNALKGYALATHSHKEEYIECTADEEDTQLVQIYSGMNNCTTKRACINIDGDVWIWDIFKESDGYGVVKACQYSEYGSPDLKVRTLFNSIWSEWAWENPPMLEEVEYLTTERHLGKPVYTQIVDCGDAEDGKAIDITDIGATSIIRHWGVLADETVLPYIHSSTTNSWSIWLVVRVGEIIIWCGSSRAGNNVKAQLWYTKD